MSPLLYLFILTETVKIVQCAATSAVLPKSGNLGQQIFGPIQIPVLSRHQVKLLPANSKLFNQISPVLVVEANPLPLKIVLKSESSDFIVEHSHKGKPGAYSQSTHEDKPLIYHKYIRRPIIHNVHEEIYPERNVVQKFHPLKENTKSIFTGRLIGSSKISNEYTTEVDYSSSTASYSDVFDY